MYHKPALPTMLLALSLLMAAPAEAAAVQLHSAVNGTAVEPPSSSRSYSEQQADALQAQAQSQAQEAYDARSRSRSAARSRARARINRAEMSWVTLERKYPGIFVTHGSRTSRKAALTFDDVPDPRYTGKVLDILARHRVKATFFVLGSLAARYPSLVRRMDREGHSVGNHSYSHALFSQLTREQFSRQIRRTDDVLRPLVGYSPRFIRPPYGEVRPVQLQWAKQNGYVIVNWDVDSVDWRSLRSRAVIVNIRKSLQPGSIILQHAGGGSTQDLSGTVEALPAIIRLLRSKGYELVTVPALLGASDGRWQ